MGEVFRATQRGTDRVVAVKFLHAGLETEERQRLRFEREARALGRLEHPGIVKVFDVGEEGGRPYFSMEYVPGGTVAGRLKVGPRLDARAGAGLIAAVARAVDAAHKAGVLHRDLKPSNILLGPDGSPKVSDFGLALFLDNQSRQTNTGALIGTPAYMSPEQAVGLKTLGPPADIYSLGATLYEILTGRPPYEGTIQEIIRKVESDPVVPPRKLMPDLHPALEAVCLTCLEKNPRDRYSSAAALADDLERWGRGEGTSVKPLGRVRRTIRQARRRWRPVAVAMLAAWAVVAGVVLWARGPEPAAEPDPPVTWPGNNSPLAFFETDLLQKKKVTLVDEKGHLQWYRWLNGVAKGTYVKQDGDVLTVAHPGAGLLELLPDPVSESYRVRARLRHDRSLNPVNRTGTEGVGLFAAYTVYPRPGLEDVHAVVQLTFNTVDSPVMSVGAAGQLIPPDPNTVTLCPRMLVGQGGVGNDKPLHGPPGVPVEARGVGRGVWIDLELTVTSKQIEGRVTKDGKMAEPVMVLTRSEIERLMSEQMQRPWVGAQGLPGRAAIYTPRAGVGLVVSGETVSVLDLVVNPL
jgi:serine/threonine-protein kinase